MKKFYNKQPNFDKYWWINSDLPGEDSAEINLSRALDYRNYNQLKAKVWKWFRSNVARKDLSSREQICLWCICERYRGSSFSTWCSYSYMSKMISMNRKTVAKAISILASEDVNLIWIVQEGEERIAMRSLPSRKPIKKHFVLVGFNEVLADEE